MLMRKRSMTVRAARGLAAADGLREIDRKGGSIGLVPVWITVLFFALAGCSNLTGWHIPGTEKSALPTTRAYLVLENVETVPENLRMQGEIYVDDAFFGHTKRPTYYKFVGNALVVGSVQIEKEKTHTIRVEFPGYEPFEYTRYFGTLREYSISFRLKRIEAGPAVAWESETEAEQPEQKRWYQFWR